MARTGSAGTEATELSDEADLIKEAVCRQRAHCEDAWSADGKLRTEGYMRLKSSLYAYGQKDRFASFTDTLKVPKKSEAELRAIFDISMSYLEKAALEHINNDKKKEAHVRLLIKYCMTFDWEYAIEACKRSLINLCAKGGVWGTYAPKALQANIARYCARHPDNGLGLDPVTLCVDVLRQAGLDTSRICAEYWRLKDAACAELVTRLARSDKRHAGRMASVGLELFPCSVRVAAAALGVFDPASEGALRARCVMYAADPTSEHYEAAKASPFWGNEWVRRLACMLAVRGEFDAELGVLCDAKLDEEILTALLHDGTAHAALKHKDLAHVYQDQYYEICRRIIEGYAEECDEDVCLNDEVLTCLQIMREIPGHAAEFEAFCDELIGDPHTCKYLGDVIASARDGA